MQARQLLMRLGVNPHEHSRDRRICATNSVENRLEGGRSRGEVGFVVNVIYADESDSEAEAQIDRLLASMLKVKPCVQ